MKLESAAFAEGGTIPERYTCSGDDVSPPLAIRGVPKEAKSLVLICDDPDAPAGTWTHWLIWNLDPKLGLLPEAIVKAQFALGGSAAQGVNDFGRVGYGGPCPPPGKPHRYFFRLFALNSSIKLAPGATRAQLEKAIKGLVVDEAFLMGRFGRKG